MPSLEPAILHGDVLEVLGRLPSESVHLIVTSPPFNVGINYDNHDDNMSHVEYLEWMYKVWSECYRVLVHGGRICINVDATMNLEEGGLPERVHPLHVDFTNQLRYIGYIYRAEICWTKQNAPGKDTAWGCYDEETSVLTKNGMKKFSDVTYDDYLATLNLQTREVEYQKPSFLVKKRYTGALKHIKSKSFDLLVTPDHNMLFWDDYNKQLVIRSLSSMPKNFMIPKTTNGMADALCMSEFVLSAARQKPENQVSDQPISIDMDIWLSFLGVFCANGNVCYREDNEQYKVSVYTKPCTINEVSYIIERMPFSFKYNDRQSEFYVCDQSLASYLNCYGSRENRTFPEFIHNLSVRQQRIFLDALFLGGGQASKHNKDYLEVFSNKFVSQLCSILVNCGYHFSVSQKDMSLNQPTNIIRLHKDQYYNINQLPLDTEYDGYVYCAEVPNHTLFVGRNGKYTWCGNSYCLCSNPHIRRNSEYIIIASKGTLTLDGDHMKCDLTKEEFHEWTLSEWKMTPETRKKGHPAPYPRELVKRCIKLFSYVGNTVLDPFNGSGTTTSTAKELGRVYVGIDCSEKYCREARNAIRKIEQEMKISGPYQFTPAPIACAMAQAQKKANNKRKDLFSDS